MLRALTIAVLAGAVAPAAAPAKDVEFRLPEAGPELAGDRIAWIEAAFGRSLPGGFLVVTARPDGSGRVTTHIRPGDRFIDVSLAATRRRVTVVSNALSPDEDVAGFAGGVLWSGRPWQRLTRQRGCKLFLAPALATDEAWGAGCAGRLATRDAGGPVRLGPAVPASPLRVRDSAMAGPYLATRLGDRSEIGVFDRRTGAELYRVAPGVADELALDDDGSVAFPLPNGRVGWASIAAPTVHELPVGGPVVQLAIDGGRVAVRAFASEQDLMPDGSPIRIVRLDGSPVGTYRVAGRWDFDDGRLLRTYQVAAVRVRAWVVRVP